MASLPRDQFDDARERDGRVGAHRAPARRGRGWVAFAWAALATGVLVLVGLFALSRLDTSFSLGLPQFGGATAGAASGSASASPTASPVTNPSALPSALASGLSISVLNGTSDSTLATKAAAQLQKDGWPAPGAADSSSKSITKTVVYFSDANYEGVARGIAQQLGAGTVQLSDAYPGASVTVLLGSDYKPAG